MTVLPLVIGHRGASRAAPENTLASFRLAFAQGADGIEADFRLTRDGAIVCLHDDSARRTSGVDLQVADATLDDLRRLEVGAWKDAKWTGERIPTLDEVLGELPAGKRIFIELKGGPEMLHPLAQTLAQGQVTPQQIRLLTFDKTLVRQLKVALPGYKTCWLTDYRRRGAWSPTPSEVLATLEEIGADGVASRAREVLDAPFVCALREKSAEIHVWTVDDPGGAHRFSLLGVDSIMTNRPAWLRRTLAGGAQGACCGV